MTDALSHGIREDEVKILIDVKGDDREILNNIEGDLSHEIRRGEVKILNNMEGDLSHEIRVFRLHFCSRIYTLIA